MDEVRIPAWEEIIRNSINEARGTPVVDWRVRALEQVDSTMDEARALLPEVSENSPGLLVARRQHQGRGRRGNRWSGSAGNLFATFAFADPQAKARGGFALVTALAAAEILNKLRCETLLKWPNDLLSKSCKKLGGILIERCAVQGRSFLSIGIGLNLETVPEGVPEAAAVRQEGGDQVEAPRFAGRLAPALYSFWRIFGEKGFLPFRDAWLSRAAYRDEEIEIDIDGRRIRGRFTGLDEEGRLQLADGRGGTHLIVSGHVLAAGENAARENRS